MTTPDRNDRDDPRRRLPEDPRNRDIFVGGEIPQAERAWRPTDESDQPPEQNDALAWAVESLPTALREIRQEVRRAADLASDALATASAAAGGGPGVRPGIDPLPAALRELREEVREAGDRATEALAATRQGMETVPSLLGAFRDELQAAVGRISDVMSSANQEAARAFTLVAREVRALADRNAVLREEVRLLGKRLEELERLRRRQATRTSRLSEG